MNHLTGEPHCRPVVLLHLKGEHAVLFGALHALAEHVCRLDNTSSWVDINIVPTGKLLWLEENTAAKQIRFHVLPIGETPIRTP